MPGILEAVARGVLEHRRLALELGPTGAFPNLGGGRVVWVGVRGDTEALLRLQSSVEQAVQRAGFEAEPRTFRPHITLGRAKKGLAFSLPHNVAALDPVPVQVDRLTLMASDLKPGGAVYTSLGVAALYC